MNIYSIKFSSQKLFHEFSKIIEDYNQNRQSRDLYNNELNISKTTEYESTFTNDMLYRYITPSHQNSPAYHVKNNYNHNVT